MDSQSRRKGPETSAGISSRSANVGIVDQIGPTWGTMTFYLALFPISLVRTQGLFGKEVAV